MKKNIYLFQIFGTKNGSISKGTLPTAKAMLYESICDLYEYSDNGFIFTSPVKFEELRKIIKIPNSIGYIFVDLTKDYYDGRIDGKFLGTNIEHLVEINCGAFNFDMDCILDKISKTGEDSLTQEEKYFLYYKKDKKAT